MVVRERQDLREGGVLRKSVTTARPITRVIICIQLLNNANKPIHVELEMQDGTGSAVVEIFVKKVN